MGTNVRTIHTDGQRLWMEELTGGRVWGTRVQDQVLGHENISGSGRGYWGLGKSQGEKGGHDHENRQGVILEGAVLQGFVVGQP